MSDSLDLKGHSKSLTDICRIVLGEKSDSYQSLDDEVIEWVNNVMEAVKVEVDLFGNTNYKAKQRLHKLYHLLRECVLTHRWQPATQVLVKLAAESYPQIGTTIARVATQVLYQTDSQDEGEYFLKRLLKDIRSFGNVDFLKIVYERMLHLLSQNKLEEIRKFKTSVQNVVTNYRIKFPTPDTQRMLVLLDAYQGMIHYIEWKTTKADMEKSERLMEDDPSHLLERSVGDDAKVDRLGKQALECFAAVNKMDGVFDIFLSAQIEIHVDNEETYLAVQLLEDYVSRNPTNQVAKAKLYDVYGADAAEKKLELLKNICKQDPSHTLAVTLYQQLHQKGENCVPILFDFLDCPSHQNELLPWKLLAEHLLDLKKNGLEEDMSSVGWNSDRKSWWPAFHFTKYNLVNSSPQVLESKLVVGYILLNEERDLLDAVVLEHCIESQKISSAKKP